MSSHLAATACRLAQGTQGTETGKTMTFNRPAALAAAFLALAPGPARAETVVVCTAIADADTGETIRLDGDCGTRAPPASTFKIPISLMAFDAGFMKDERTPALPFREGYADWVAAWRTTTDPARWMTESVVWYSRKATEALGEERFARYVDLFDYGNRDVSGDPGRNNGLTNAWLSSSLQITPVEQLAFLRKVARRELPVSAHAHEMTRRLVDIGPQPGGWHVYGKTGAAPSRNPDGSTISGKPWGWFVGWATRGERTVVFARLTRDTTRPAVSPGRAARAAVLRELFAAPDSF